MVVAIVATLLYTEIVEFRWILAAIVLAGAAGLSLGLLIYDGGVP